MTFGNVFAAPIGQYGLPTSLKNKYISQFINKLPNKEVFKAKNLTEAISIFNAKSCKF
jgi:hypothetical protein